MASNRTSSTTHQIRSATPVEKPVQHPVVVGYEPGDEHAVEEALVQAGLRATGLSVVAGAPLPDDLHVRLLRSGVALAVVLPPEGADVTEAVLDLAERVRAALVVVGLPRRGVGDLLGGRARLVVLDAPCPVLSVPEPVPTTDSLPPAVAVTMGV